MLNGEIVFDRENYLRELQKFNNNQKNIIMESPEVLDYMAELFPEIREKCDHEKSHYLAACKHGLQPIFGMYFIKYDLFGFRYGIQLLTLPGLLPAEMSDGMYLDALRAMIAAPADLSTSDFQMLGL